jgi:hypothetical protein
MRVYKEYDSAVQAENVRRNIVGYLTIPCNSHADVYAHVETKKNS